MTNLNFISDLKDLIRRTEEDDRFLNQIVDDVEELIAEYDTEC